MESAYDTSFTQNRELSWLKFNRRVLEEARDASVPLYERLKFIAIFSSNLDEFFMIRVGSLYDLSLLKEPHIDNKSGLTPAEQLQAIFKAIPPLYKLRDKTLSDVEEQLREHDLYRLSPRELEKKERAFAADYFNRYVLPVLSPQIVDLHHPFPHLGNKTLHLALLLKGEKGSPLFALIPIPSLLPRLLFLPGNSLRYVLLEELISEYASSVFSQYQVLSKAVVCVTRNADISPEDEGYEIDSDYRHHMKRILKKRERLAPVRLETQGDGDGAIASYLCDKLHIRKDQVFRSKSPLDLSYVYTLESKLPASSVRSLVYPPFQPQPPASVSPDESLLRRVERQDLLLSFPYEQMDPFLRLIQEAAFDPEVISIKITIYRLARKAKLIQYLAEAAENGKEVTVLMELRARFDEQNNINWSEALEESGCKILYGFEGFKVHSKICLITRRSKNRISYLTQIGTGNYNEKTARLYTDFSLMTADYAIGCDAAEFFKNMSIGNLEGQYSRLLVAPTGFKSGITALIDGEIMKVQAGMQGRIRMKMNSLTDRQLIDKLSEASCAGVKIDLIVRGICCLIPGVPGKTENITVRSIVGRFLEHSRIYCFGDGPDCRLYLSSADLMTRNTERRVEIACPIEERETCRRLLSFLEILMRDTCKARLLGPDGDYRPLEGEEPFNAQEYLLEEASRNAAQIDAPRSNLLSRLFRRG